MRGLNLDRASEVRLREAKGTARVVAKGKAAVPNQQPPAAVGDTQVEVEVTLPPDTPAGTVSLVVVTPAGETPPHALLVERSLALAAEKEPNNGFRQAQPITLPQAVDGAVGQPQDVDVFRLEGKAGQQWVLEVFAARHGSPLDPLLTLYDADGQTVASADDSDGSTDARLEVTLPKTGVYYLSLIDAHDQGGPAHVYRLSLRAR